LPGAAPDDVLDAFVLCWTARRFLRRQAVVLGDGEVDSTGLRMEIVA
jgi:predicted RNase H-like nuclease